MNQPVYLDHNATTPVDPRVARAMQPFLENQYGNPSSTHAWGVQARLAVERAREQVAALLHCRPDEVVFTSGGTEANNHAIKGAAFELRDRGTHIITSRTEHPAVTEVCRFLETQEFTITWLETDASGRVSLEQLNKAIRPDTILITIMHANNEVGTIQPVEEIGRLAARHNILFHSDAAQTAGKIPIDVQGMGASLLSVAGHKMYAPKGVGALYVKRGVRLQKLLHGAGHERELRAGTENVPEIVGLGEAAAQALDGMEQNRWHMLETRDRLQELICESLPFTVVNGHPVHRLPNTLSIAFPDLEAGALLDELTGIAASAGAACHAGDESLSPVLSAMGLPPDIIRGTIRLSTGRQTTMEEVERAAAEIVEAVKRLRGDVPSPEISAGEPVRLTRYTHGLGCACKVRPQYLEALLKNLPSPSGANVLAGPAGSEDAAVYKLTVQSVDFFTPVVDDPYDFGAIAAANALSDIYAMGGRPLFALNIVGFPTARLPMEVLQQILKGAADKAAEAGIEILGGHTVEDAEPKFGMVVTGTVHPEQIRTNSGARPGDVLVLTKPLGTGIIATAIKRGMAGEQSKGLATRTMASLNEAAALAMQGLEVHACTDITGFGLLGHLKEMAAASGVNVELDASRIPILPDTEALVLAGAIPGGTRSNREHTAGATTWPDDLPETTRWILCDAQTSGGLLLSLPEEEADTYLNTLQEAHGIRAALIGRVSGPGAGLIRVIS